mmetsp:Transcript_19523/g.27003  ORF Transcript_19523/g.27003 Transcript_19523/m.27003 type:complete len:366 (+) Transcript_19523:1320-2417(+)
MVFPFTIIFAMQSWLPRMSLTMGYTEMPPVLRPMVWVNLTKSMSSVPMFVKHLQNRGTKGSNDEGIDFMSNAASAYKTLFVNKSWRRTVAPSFSSTSQGTLMVSVGISDREREGMHFNASRESGVSCFFLRDTVFAISSETSASVRDFLKLASCSFSAASAAAPRETSGWSSRVTLWGLSIRSLRIRGPKTSSPAARRALNEASAAVYFMGSKASPSYSQEDMERSIRESPRGNLPVLFSRRLNSMVFTAASTASSSNPSLANCSRVSITSFSTLATSSGFTPLSPMEKVGCRSSSDNPPPTMSSPSPEASSAFCSGAALVPSMRKLRKSKAKAVSRGKRSSARSQFTQRKVLASSSAVSEAAYF